MQRHVDAATPLELPAGHAVQLDEFATLYVCAKHPACCHARDSARIIDFSKRSLRRMAGAVRRTYLCKPGWHRSCRCWHIHPDTCMWTPHLCCRCSSGMLCKYLLGHHCRNPCGSLHTETTRKQHLFRTTRSGLTGERTGTYRSRRCRRWQRNIQQCMLCTGSVQTKKSK